MTNKTPLHDELEFELESESLRFLSTQMRQLPYLDPPERLLPSVMGAIRGRRFPLWYRCLRWVRSPRTLTLTPLQVASLASVFVLVTVLGTLHFLRSDQRDDFKSGLQGLVPITLTLEMPEARSVSVVGTFNAWHEKGYEMAMDRVSGTWSLVLRLPSGRYEYAFVLDGKKIIADPEAAFLADDGFGNQNAVLIVGKRYDKAI